MLLRTPGKWISQANYFLLYFDILFPQMIMGAGKTTVVGPLLATLLASGESLITEVSHPIHERFE